MTKTQPHDAPTSGQFVFGVFYFLGIAFLSGTLTAVCLPSPLNGQQESAELQQEINRYTDAIQADPEDSISYYHRGRAFFCLGEFDKAVRDFNQHVTLSPKSEARQWERGIAFYYNGNFAEGANQFELYQSYHDNDVENSAWRFLCMAKSSSVQAARESLLEIRNDTRVPMMEIYRMFQGELTPETVLEKAKESSGSATADRWQQFYAHLYVGLYLDATGGDQEQVMMHLTKAQANKVPHYMWNVADVDVKRRLKLVDEKN